MYTAVVVFLYRYNVTDLAQSRHVLTEDKKRHDPV